MIPAGTPGVEPIPLPVSEERLASLLSGTAPEQQLDASGRYVAGLFAGMTPADVHEDRRRFERGGDSSLLRRLREAE